MKSNTGELLGHVPAVITSATPVANPGLPRREFPLSETRQKGDLRKPIPCRNSSVSVVEKPCTQMLHTVLEGRQEGRFAVSTPACAIGLARLWKAQLVRRVR